MQPISCSSVNPDAAAMYGRLRQTMPHLKSELRPDATFAECGGDSLDFVELCCAIDADYGVRLSVNDLEAAPTIGALLERVDARAQRRPATDRPS